MQIRINFIEQANKLALLLSFVTNKIPFEIRYILNTLYICKIKKGIRRWQTQQHY